MARAYSKWCATHARYEGSRVVRAQCSRFVKVYRTRVPKTIAQPDNKKQGEEVS